MKRWKMWTRTFSQHETPSLVFLSSSLIQIQVVFSGSTEYLVSLCQAHSKIWPLSAPSSTASSEDFGLFPSQDSPWNTKAERLLSCCPTLLPPGRTPHSGLPSPGYNGLVLEHLGKPTYNNLWSSEVYFHDEWLDSCENTLSNVSLARPTCTPGGPYLAQTKMDKSCKRGHHILLWEAAAGKSTK